MSEELNEVVDQLNEVVVTCIKGNQVTVKTKHGGKATVQCLMSGDYIWLRNDELFVGQENMLSTEFFEREKWRRLAFEGKPLTLSLIYGALNTGKPIHLLIYRGWIVDAKALRKEETS